MLITVAVDTLGFALALLALILSASEPYRNMKDPYFFSSIPNHKIQIYFIQSKQW